MTDREIIEALAEFVGLKGQWIAHVDPKDWEYEYVSSEKRAAFVVKQIKKVFDPLQDANDERMVIEEMRRRQLSGHMALTIRMMDKINAAGRSATLDWVLHDQKVGDISQAVYEVIKDE